MYAVVSVRSTMVDRQPAHATWPTSFAPKRSAGSGESRGLGPPAPPHPPNPRVVIASLSLAPVRFASLASWIKAS